MNDDGVAPPVEGPDRRRELRQRLAEQRRALRPGERIAAAQGLRRSLEDRKSVV